VHARVAPPRLALAVKGVDLAAGACDSCLGVTSRLKGTLGIDTAVSRTRVPMTVDATFDAEVTVDQVGDSWVVQLQPRELRDLDVKLSRLGLGYARPLVRKWIDKNLLADVPPQEITTPDGDELPVRAVRVVPNEDAVQVHVLTAIARGRAVPIVHAIPVGWRLDISTETLAGLAATQAYRMGPLDHNVVPVPTSLALEDDRFTLGLRLWRLSGRGWWRDYEVTGTVGVARSKLELEPTEAKRVRASAGAAIADPLATLGQGVILDTIESALKTTLPAIHHEDIDELRTRVALNSLTGAQGVVIAEGRLHVGPIPEGATDQREAKSKRKEQSAKSQAR